MMSFFMLTHLCLVTKQLRSALILHATTLHYHCFKSIIIRSVLTELYFKIAFCS